MAQARYFVNCAGVRNGDRRMVGENTQPVEFAWRYFCTAEDGEDTEDDRLVDDEVDVVQAVFEDGDRRRSRKCQIQGEGLEQPAYGRGPSRPAEKWHDGGDEDRAWPEAPPRSWP